MAGKPVGLGCRTQGARHAGGVSLTRDDYLRASSVRCFVAWLRRRVRGEVCFEHGYRMPRPPRDWRCRSLWEAYEGYRWRGTNFETTQETLDCLRREIRAASEAADNCRFVTAALEVLNWGGVSRSNKERLCGLGDRALGTFSEAASLLDPARADTARLGGVQYMNSGWTKVYSLMLDAFPMYDGRVGAAMGYFVRLWWRATRPDRTDEEACRIPDLLRFRWLAGRGGRNRNPSAGCLELPQLSHTNPQTWAECNVRAAWILGVVRSEGEFGELPADRRLRALEAALFMIGYEIPRDSP